MFWFPILSTLPYASGGVRPAVDVAGAMCVFGAWPSVLIDADLAGVPFPGTGNVEYAIRYGFPPIYSHNGSPVVPDGQLDLLRDNTLAHQIERQQLRHFPDDEPGFFCVVGLHEHLPGGDAVGFRLVGLDGFDFSRLPAPCVVDHKLRIDAEGAV